MTSKLELYNEALLILGADRLASLAETSTAKYALDDAYDKVLAFALEQGFWNFAMRAVQADSSASVEPTFGYTKAFAKPSDWVRTYAISANDSLTPPLLDYVDEPNYWYAHPDPLFIKYVSNDAAYGLDLSIWSETFADYVANRLAVKTCKRITGSMPSDELLKAEQRSLAGAKSIDAMNEPPGFPPRGTWVRGRSGSSDSGQRRDSSPINF